MLQEERFNKILEELAENGAVKNIELSRKLNVSLERLLIEYGIQYRSERGHEGRRIYLTYMGSQRDDM